jgi:chromate transporter
MKAITAQAHGTAGDSPRGSALEVLGVAIRLGLTSFGGPVAHLGYFREEYVRRLKWITEDAYGDIVALCQLLPGPTSSQVGIAVGIVRAGMPGAVAAWSWARCRSPARFAGAPASRPRSAGSAAVVGLLLAALYHPVWTSAIKSAADFALALVAFALLAWWNAPAWLVVVIAALGGAMLGAL